MKLLKRDLTYIFSSIKNLMLIYIFLLILSQVFILPHKEYNSMDLFMVMAGDVGYIDNFQSYTPPIQWFLFQLIPCFITLLAVYQDHIQNASYTILKTRSRKKYFLSKIFSAIIVIFLMNLLLYVIIFIDTILISGFKFDSFLIFTRLIVSYCLVQMTIFLIAFIISIKFGYKFGISSIMFQLVISMTTNFKGFLGQQSLIMKQDVSGGYISMADNVIVLSIYLLISAIVSYFIFKSYDFLGGDND